MRDVILGLDVSTSIIGWALVAADAKPSDVPIQMSYIDLRKIEGFWNKADTVNAEILRLCSIFKLRGDNITKFSVEDPVTKFQRGKSSAGTIVLLAKFNAITSYFGRLYIGIDPVYINATDARRKLGIKLQSRKKSGLSQKEQTFLQLSQTVFKNEIWPVNRNNKIQPFCYDQVDAFVIAMAAI